MNPISFLRQLADNLQYPELCQQATESLLEAYDPCVHAILAMAHAQLGQFAKALEIYDRLGVDYPNPSPELQIELSGAACALRRVEEAQAYAELALQVLPDDSLALARLAWCWMQQNQFDEALELYRKSLDIEPSRLPVWIGLLRLLLEKDLFDEAQNYLAEAIVCFNQKRESFATVVEEAFLAQLRSIQLEIWVLSEQFDVAEHWFEERYEDLDEDVWCELLVHYTALLSMRDYHSMARERLSEGGKKYPHNKLLIIQLIELTQVQGHFKQAMQAAKRLLKLDEESISAWCRLSNVCLHRFDKEARKAAEKAVELADQLQEGEEYTAEQVSTLQILAKTTLATVESQEQNYEIAGKLFKEVLSQNEFYGPAIRSFAQQCMQEGDIDQALELYEKLKEIDPVNAYAALINARHFPEDESVLSKMEKAAQMKSLEGKGRSSLYFQLAAAWEKRKDYDKAIDCAHKANEVSRKFLNYSAKEHRNKCARIRHVFSKALFDHRKECGHESTLPVFVLGMPRSGTTLVEQVLAGHSKIYGAGELGVIPQRVSGLERWERHVGSGRHYPDCIDDLSPVVAKGVAEGILTELRELAEKDKPEAEYVVDKLPHNFENVGFIKFLFPNAKIISVRRDPRDIAMSNYFTDYQAKHGGMGFSYDLRSIGEQLADHNLLMHYWGKLFPGEILEIPYENVVDDLEGSARKMLDYIGVDWEQQVLDFNKLDRPVKTASVWQVRQPIYKTSKAKWKRYEKYLAPLLQGTNTKIQPDPIEDHLVLPVPGLLQEGVAFYKDGRLRDAEICFKKMLHHNPEHAAANYMVGLVYCSVDNTAEGADFIEKALSKCPWQKEWRENFKKACEILESPERFESFKKS